MRIAGVYSFNRGKETIAPQHQTELEEILQVVEKLDAERCKTKVSAEKTMRDRVLYSPSALHEAFKELFSARNWVSHKIITEYSSKEYYVPGYSPPAYTDQESVPFREMDFVKNKVGVEIQFNEFSMVYSGCAKMTIFAKLGVIDCGVEIVPVKAFAEEMSTGVSYFEQFVWDLEHRGVSDIDIPVLILGIDTDGIQPQDLKIAETRQRYFFSLE